MLGFDAICEDAICLLPAPAEPVEFSARQPLVGAALARVAMSGADNQRVPIAGEE